LTLALFVSACGGSDGPADVTTDTAVDTSPDAGTDVMADTDTTIVEPGYATIAFSVDDSQHAHYAEADFLAWKGAFKHNPTTNIITYDAA